jgi:hypothetical protein
MIKILILTILPFLCLGCGVKGDPLPPIEPETIGRGKPTYKRAVKNFKVNENANDVEDEQEEEEADEE